jgi:putative tryptophan/tyrosine transport system substrate-binding protein
MRRGELIASLAAKASASPASMAPAHSNLSALDRCMRTFRVLAAIAVGLISFPYEASAQEQVRRIAFLGGVPVPEVDQPFRNELRARGYDVGRNLQIEYRDYQGQFDRIPALVAEIVASRPDIMVATSPQTALAVRAAAPTIPFVFITIADPVGLGLVPEMARPGGNVTGIATMVPEGFGSKMLELLKTVAPAASRIAILANPTNQMHQRGQLEMSDAARRLGVELVTVQASKVEDLEGAFQEARERGVEAIDVLGDPVTFRASAKIANLTLQYRWPSIYLFRHNVEDGGLMSYGPNAPELWRSAARQMASILKGTKPGDLPVEQPTRFDLSINLTTAKALGITIPATLLAQAAELIE